MVVCAPRHTLSVACPRLAVVTVSTQRHVYFCAQQGPHHSQPLAVIAGTIGINCNSRIGGATGTVQTLVRNAARSRTPARDGCRKDARENNTNTRNRARAADVTYLGSSGRGSGRGSAGRSGRGSAGTAKLVIEVGSWARWRSRRSRRSRRWLLVGGAMKRYVGREEQGGASSRRLSTTGVGRVESGWRSRRSRRSRRWLLDVGAMKRSVVAPAKPGRILPLHIGAARRSGGLCLSLLRQSSEMKCVSALVRGTGSGGVKPVVFRADVALEPLWRVVDRNALCPSGLPLAERRGSTSGHDTCRARHQSMR